MRAEMSSQKQPEAASSSEKSWATVPHEEALRLRYQELTTTIWTSLNIYLRGSTMALAIIGFALGYLFKVPLAPFHARILCFCVIIILGFWYACSAWALGHYSSLLRSIEDTANALMIPFVSRNYFVCKLVVISALIAVVPILAIFAYLIVRPPIVVP